MGKSRAKTSRNATVAVTTTTVNRRGGRRTRRRVVRRATQRNLPTTTITETTKLLPNAARARRVRRRNRRNATSSAAATFRQQITATLGTVGSNQGDQIELEMSALINPALVKESTGSNQYGPLQMYAANYNLWRCGWVVIKLTPLVGSSAVSGTAVRVSLNMAAQPGSPSWSALGARKHRDTNPGRPLVFKLRGADLLGPKEGWFLTNTKNDPQMCIGGSLEIHTLGKTMSTYQNAAFTGPLFLVEMTAEWQFKNYNPEPGMLTLVKTDTQESPQQVKINSKPGEPITISVPNDSTFARVAGGPEINAGATPSEIIWQVCDTTMDVVTGVLPPPFEWLFRAGWWFVKRIANKKTTGDHVDGEPDAGEVTFQVYQSIQDAQNGVPCIATGAAASTNTTVTGWDLTQVTPGNVGNPQTSLAVAYTEEGLSPQQPFFYVSLEPGSSDTWLTAAHMPQTDPTRALMIKQEGGDQKVYSFLAYKVTSPRFIQADPDRFVDPSELSTPTYPIYHHGPDGDNQIGTVYAANTCILEKNGGGANIYAQWTLVLWKCETGNTIKYELATGTNVSWWRMDPRIASGAQMPTYSLSVDTRQNLSLPQQTVQLVSGAWYLSTFTCYNGNLAFENYGIKFWRPTSAMSTTAATYSPTADSILNGFTPTTATPIRLYANGYAPTATAAAELASFSQSEVLRLRRMLEETGLDTDDEFEPELLISDSEDDQDDERDYPATPEPGPEECFADPPALVLETLSEEGEQVFRRLQAQGVPATISRKVAQETAPHPCYGAWQGTYHDALVDGASPPTARSLAWEQAHAALSDRGHAE
nr:MAG: ORF2 protein [Longquan rodent astrovirus 1]